MPTRSETIGQIRDMLSTLSEQGRFETAAEIMDDIHRDNFSGVDDKTVIRIYGDLKYALGERPLIKDYFVAGGLYQVKPFAREREFRLVRPSGPKALPYVWIDCLPQHVDHHANVYKLSEDGKTATLCRRGTTPTNVMQALTKEQEAEVRAAIAIEEEEYKRWERGQMEAGY